MTWAISCRRRRQTKCAPVLAATASGTATSLASSAAEHSRTTHYTGGNKRFFVEKLVPYQDHEKLPEAKEAFEAVLKHMKEIGTETLVGETEIFIFPGYRFRVCDGLVTNFHLPGSTLILLIAAFIGEKWREVYEQALANDYRFLSYGDSSLLLPGKKSSTHNDQ